MLARIGFLASDQQYDVALPGGLNPEPLARSVITYKGARDLIFEPVSVRSSPDRDRGFALRATRLIAGYKVSTYRVRQNPPYVAAFWELADGYLYTFLDADVECGEDVESGLDRIVEALRVSPRVTIPSVRYGRGFQSGDSRDPAQREVVTFLAAHPQDAGAITVRIRNEPAWVREGTSVQKWDTFAQASNTSWRGLCIQVDGPLDQGARLQTIAQEIADSVVPAK